MVDQSSKQNISYNIDESVTPINNMPLDESHTSPLNNFNFDSKTSKSQQKKSGKIGNLNNIKTDGNLMGDDNDNHYDTPNNNNNNFPQMDLLEEQKEEEDDYDMNNINGTPQNIMGKQKTKIFSDTVDQRSSRGFYKGVTGSDSNRNQSDRDYGLGKYSAVIGSDQLGNARAILAQDDIGGGSGTPQDDISGLNLLQNLGDDHNFVHDNNNHLNDSANNPFLANYNNDMNIQSKEYQVNSKFDKQFPSKKQTVTAPGIGKKMKDTDYDNLISKNIYVEENNEEEIKTQSKQHIRGDILSLHDRLERLDTNYTELEDMFNDEMRVKEMDIEHLDPQEMMQKESIIEFNELKRLEKQMRRVEKDRVVLLKNQGKSENDLLWESGQRGITLEELEAQYEFKAQERERALTRLYGRLNAKIKATLLSHEGTSKFQIRKLPQYMRDRDKHKNRRLFEGIRDQRIGARWLKAPQPVEIKCQMVRGLKDKIPKGNYVIRCGVLDRMIENKIYYKFLEYGHRVKAEEEARQEKEAEQKLKEQEKKDLERQISLFQNTSNNTSQRQSMLALHNEQQQASGRQDSNSGQMDDEERQLVIFHDSEEEDDGSPDEVGGMKFDNSHDHSGHNNNNNKVQFGFGTKEHDLERGNNNNNSKFRFSKQGSLNKQSLQKITKIVDPEEQKRMEFEKLARYSLYKPEGGSLTSAKIKENQNLEKVWIDFGKQHTKLVEFDATHDSEEMHFHGHKIYFIVPPNMYLQPSNVLIFELIWLSSQTQKEDYVVAWGAFPLVNGDFEINEGKFKLPLLNGNIDFSNNKFKDIEKKYIRNVDEWLGNLYIEVKKFELVDFQMYNQRIEFKVPIEQSKEEKKLMKQQLKQETTKGNDKEQQENYSDESDNESEFDPDDYSYQGLIQDDTHIDYHNFKYRVNQSNINSKNNYENQDLTIRKIQYVTGELLSDLGLAKLNIFSALQTLFIAFVVVWLRMAFHYLGQYLILKAMNAPVMSMDLAWYKVKINYAYWNIGQEVAVITVGVVSNTIILALLILICYLSQKYIFCFPSSFCRFIAWYGIATVFDFFLIAVIDFAVQDWDGDLFKLYSYYNKSNSSGFVGYFLTFIIQLGLLIINLFIFYNYVVFVHLDGRLADIWSRISGKVKNFYIPHDNEVSFNYLRNLYQIGEINNNRIIVNQISTYNSKKFGMKKGVQNNIEMSKLIHFYKFESEISLQSGRVFHANQKGQIYEINIEEIGKQHDDNNLEYYLKNVSQFLKPEHRIPEKQINNNMYNSRDENEMFHDTLKKIGRRMTLNSQSFTNNRNKVNQSLQLMLQGADNDNNGLFDGYLNGGMTNTFDNRRSRQRSRGTNGIGRQNTLQNNNTYTPNVNEIKNSKQSRTSLVGIGQQIYQGIKKVGNFSAKSRKSNGSGYQQVNQFNTQRGINNNNNQNNKVHQNGPTNNKFQQTQSPLIKTDEEVTDNLLNSNRNLSTKNPFKKMNNQENSNIRLRQKDLYHSNDQDDNDISHREDSESEIIDDVQQLSHNDMNKNFKSNQNLQPLFNANNLNITPVQNVPKSLPTSTKNKMQKFSNQLQKSSQSGKTSPQNVVRSQQQQQQIVGSQGISNTTSVRSSLNGKVIKKNSKGGKSDKKNKNQSLMKESFKQDE